MCCFFFFYKYACSFLTSLSLINKNKWTCWLIIYLIACQWLFHQARLTPVQVLIEILYETDFCRGSGNNTTNHIQRLHVITPACFVLFFLPVGPASDWIYSAAAGPVRECDSPCSQLVCQSQPAAEWGRYDSAGTKPPSVISVLSASCNWVQTGCLVGCPLARLLFRNNLYCATSYFLCFKTRVLCLQVSDRQNYLLLSLLLCLCLGLFLCFNHCRITFPSSSEPEPPGPKSYTYCNPDR